MARYIDADEFSDKLFCDGFFYGLSSALNSTTRKRKFTIGEIRGMVQKAPTADVAPVVRCGSCKHMENQNGIRFCGVWNHANGMGDDGFCNYGEMRADNG